MFSCYGFLCYLLVYMIEDMYVIGGLVCLWVPSLNKYGSKLKKRLGDLGFQSRDYGAANSNLRAKNNLQINSIVSSLDQT
jgi:hypothetical protein